jgi:hypothetical protein
LEPACGSGNFLVQVLKRKLAAVEKRYGKSDFERRHFALFGLMCIYGIELLADNVGECRANLLAIFAEYLGLDPADDLYRAAVAVLSVNLVQGDALTMLDHTGKPIVFPEWGYLGVGRFNRRDFRFANLTQSASYSQLGAGGEGALFGDLGKHEVFQPDRTYPPVSVADLAALSPEVS